MGEDVVAFPVIHISPEDVGAPSGEGEGVIVASPVNSPVRSFSFSDKALPAFVEGVDLEPG